MFPTLQGSSPSLQSGGVKLQGSAGVNLNNPNQTITPSNYVSGNATVKNLQNTLNSTDNFINSQTASLLQQQNALLREQATPAPVLNYQSVLANAQAKAANPGSSVNKLYQSQLNNYLQNAAAQQKLAQQQRQQGITGAQQELANTQAQLGQQQKVTGEQTSLDLGNISNQRNLYQQEQGIAGTQNLTNLRQQQGQSGLEASGIAGGQEFQQNLARQVSENAQESQFDYQRNTSLLNESNTFAQIAQAGTYAQQQEGLKEGQANLDLNKFLQQAAYSKTQAQSQLGQWRQIAQSELAQNLAAQQVSAFINSYRNNPTLYSKAMQAYAPLTGGTSQTALPQLPGVNA